MIDVVIAHYTESLDWLPKLAQGNTARLRIFLYNKSPHRVKNPDILKCVHWYEDLPNQGREGGTWLYHITKHYEDLGEVTVFLQGNPFEHVMTIPRTLFTESLIPMAEKLNEDDIVPVFSNVLKELYHKGHFAYEWYYQLFFGHVRDDHVYVYSPGAQYAVGRSRLLGRSLGTYKLLHKMINDMRCMPYDMTPEYVDGYIMERLWMYLWDPSLRWVFKDTTGSPN